MLLGSAVPLRSTRVRFVTSSPCDVPLSLPASRSGVPGTVGAFESRVMVTAVERADTFPAASAAVAVMSRVPSASGPLMTLYAVPIATPLPTGVPSE